MNKNTTLSLSKEHFTMEAIEYECPAHGCDYKTDKLEASVAVEFLKLHVSQNHGVASKPEKPRKPSLKMVGNSVDTLEWDTFLHQFAVYKKLSGVSGDAGSHLLDCLSKEVYAVLFSAYGADICQNLKLVNLIHNIFSFSYTADQN